jgi:hypothetical protein
MLSRFWFSEILSKRAVFDELKPLFIEHGDRDRALSPTRSSTAPAQSLRHFWQVLDLRSCRTSWSNRIARPGV